MGGRSDGALVHCDRARLGEDRLSEEGWYTPALLFFSFTQARSVSYLLGWVIPFQRNGLLNDYECGRFVRGYWGVANQ